MRAATVAGSEEDAPARGTQPPGALFHYSNGEFNTLADRTSRAAVSTRS